jgi:hypothetical protein
MVKPLMTQFQNSFTGSIVTDREVTQAVFDLVGEGSVIHGFI